MTKTSFMEWVDEQVGSDADLASEVDRLLTEMKVEQGLVALRERRGLSQRQAGRLIRASQPYVAKLESGRIRNVGLATLVRYAHALGGRVKVEIGSARSAPPIRKSRLRRGRSASIRSVASRRRGR